MPARTGPLRIPEIRRRHLPFTWPRIESSTGWYQLVDPAHRAGLRYTAMDDDLLDYPRLVHDALVGVARHALRVAAEQGLPGDHHFIPQALGRCGERKALIR